MKDVRKRYEIICPYCGMVQYACKSIAQEEGLANLGHGVCLLWLPIGFLPVKLLF